MPLEVKDTQELDPAVCSDESCEVNESRPKFPSSVPSKDPSVAPSVVPTDMPSFEPSLRPFDLNSLIMVTASLGGGDSLSQVQIDQMGQSFMASYNSVNDVTARALDYTNIQITSVTFVFSQNIGGDLVESFFYVVNGLCQGCFAGINFLDPDVISRDEVIQVFQLFFESGVLSSISLEEVQEVDDSPFFCESGVTEFTDLVVIDLQIICDDVPTLDDAEKTAIAEEFVSTYNALISKYCDTCHLQDDHTCYTTMHRQLLNELRWSLSLLESTNHPLQISHSIVLVLLVNASSEQRSTPR